MDVEQQQQGRQGRQDSGNKLTGSKTKAPARRQYHKKYGLINRNRYPRTPQYIGYPLQLGTQYPRQCTFGSIAGNRINHNARRLQKLHGIPQSGHLHIGSIVYYTGIMRSPYKHGLQYKISTEARQPLNLSCNSQIGIRRHIQNPESRINSRIKFKNIVIHPAKSIKDRIVPHAGGIGKGGNLYTRKIQIAQRQGILYHTAEVGIQRRFPVTGKSYHIEQFAGVPHQRKTSLESLPHIDPRRHMPVDIMLRIISALTINTVKRTQLPIRRKQIYTQRHPQTPALYRAENNTLEQFGRHWQYI